MVSGERVHVGDQTGLDVGLNRQGPRLSIRIVIWILPSDTETSAATPCERV